MDTKLILTVAGGLAYIAGVAIYVDCETTKNVKIHDGGFLGMPYTTSSNRKTTPKDIRKGLFWPVFLIWVIVKAFLWILHQFITAVFLLFGFEYRETWLHAKIKKWLD